MTRTEYADLGESAGRVEPTPGKTLTATYRYDASGGLTRAQYAEVNPANYALIRTHDDQGRQLTFSDGGGTSFVTGFRSGFFASGGFERTDFANGSSELIDFNDRLQPFFRRAFGAQGTFMMLSPTTSPTSEATTTATCTASRTSWTNRTAASTATTPSTA